MKSQKQPTGVIHGVMDDEWKKRVNKTLADIYGPVSRPGDHEARHDEEGSRTME